MSDFHFGIALGAVLGLVAGIVLAALMRSNDEPGVAE